jgi:ankyrin repeat protein
MLRTLLAMGATAGTVDIYGLSPIHKAAGFGHNEIVRVLVTTARVDVNTPTQPPQEQQQQQQQQQQEQKPSKSQQHNLLDSFASFPRETPLHIAARNGKHETVAVLLELGAHTTATSANGDTPLHVACRHNHDGGQSNWQTVATLLRHDEKAVDVRNSENRTPQQVAPLLLRLAMVSGLMPTFWSK